MRTTVTATILLATFILEGCTTPGDLVRRPPALTFTTQAKAEEVRDCFTDLAHGLLRTNAQPYGSGWRVSATVGYAGEQAAWTAQIMPTSTGTQVALYTRAMLNPATDQTKPCLDKYRAS